MKRRFHRLGVVGVALVTAALSLQPGGVAEAATTGPSLLGQHCVALRLVSGDLLRACAAVADDGTTGAFAVPLSSYGTVGVYTYDSAGGIVLASGLEYAVGIDEITLYANHEVYDAVTPGGPPFYAPAYESASGDQESIPSGYVETEVEWSVRLLGGTTAAGTGGTVWSYPVPTSSL